ncbi:hypothetical protein WJX74_007028 [Apatococcus lobatus]|uniref:Uncharacterized protein n=1 Tax=Apatococcus lobatus TaxID=904363 RepID=A0AAW1QJZ7_9CHLO
MPDTPSSLSLCRNCFRGIPGLATIEGCSLTVSSELKRFRPPSTQWMTAAGIVRPWLCMVLHWEGREGNTSVDKST